MEQRRSADGAASTQLLKQLLKSYNLTVVMMLNRYLQIDWWRCGTCSGGQIIDVENIINILQIPISIINSLENYYGKSINSTRCIGCSAVSVHLSTKVQLYTGDCLQLILIIGKIYISISTYLKLYGGIFTVSIFIRLDKCDTYILF